MTTATAVRPTPDDVTIDEVWRRATKRDLRRLVFTMVPAGAFIFVIGLMDLTTWPPRWDASHSWGFAAVMTVVFLALLIGVTARQKTSSPERYVSPLLGLSSDERRVAKRDLHDARPSDMPWLREVEIAQARQRALFSPTSLGAVFISAAVIAIGSVFMFVSGSWGLGLLFACSTLSNGWSSWKSYRNTQDAHRFLDALDGQRV